VKVIDEKIAEIGLYSGAYGYAKYYKEEILGPNFKVQEKSSFQELNAKVC